MSVGDRLSPGLPPIVPLIPEMLLINATFTWFNYYKIKGLPESISYFCQKIDPHGYSS